jgi:hypothetical protein
MLQKRAWRAAVKSGQITPGSDKSVEHVKSLDAGGGNSKTNIRIVPLRENKGWRGKRAKGAAKWR